MRVKAILQLAFLTGAAFAADGAPVQNHFVANFDVGDAFADFRYDGGGLVAKQVWVVIAYATFDIRIVRVANTAGRNIHNHFTGTRFCKMIVNNGNWAFFERTTSGWNF